MAAEQSPRFAAGGQDDGANVNTIVTGLAERLLSMREALLTRWQDAYRDGWARGWDAGYRQGLLDEDAEAARRWREAAVTIKAAIPDTPEFRASVERRLAAALAGERRDQAEHMHEFTAKASATPAARRTDVQAAWLELDRHLRVVRP